MRRDHQAGVKSPILDRRLTSLAHYCGESSPPQEKAMIGQVTRAGVVAAAVALTAACASTAGLRSAPLDAGETKFYAAPLAVVGPAARQAVLSVGLNVDTVSTPDSLTWMIIAKKGMSLFSYGELVRVVVAQTPDGAVAVRVYTKRRLATNVTAKGDWSGPIFQQLDSILHRED